ncbi:MAG: polysaccharide biosynthesis tyrosine autokinase [Alphaproteobacteria bacterium]|nr:polysaccharide biosynthesis tyrosine autokinase [Alphaproteobacteria bacterium]
MNDQPTHIEINPVHSGRLGDFVGTSSAEAPGIEADIRSLLLMLWRRKLFIIGTVFMGLALMAIAITFITPRYTARALILIESNNNQPYAKELQLVLGGAQFDTTLILGEIEVLRSRTMARQLIERLDLMNDPEFNSRIPFSQPDNPEKKQEQKPSKAEGKREILGSFKQLSVYSAEIDSLPPEVIDRQIAEVVTQFLDNLNVRAIPGSFAIQVEYTSSDPNKAALIANAVVDTYIEQRLEEKFKSTKKVTDWLDKRLSELRQQVESSEAAVQEYKVRNNLVEGTRNVVSAEQLSELNSQLVLAKAMKAETEARLAQIQALSKSPSKFENASSIVNSAVIQNLKQQEVTLMGRLSELSSRYGPKHPHIIKAIAELEEIRRALQLELGKVVDQTRNEVHFAQARVEALEGGLRELSGQRQEDNEAMIRLRALEREAEATRLIYDTFLEAYKRSDNQEELQDAQARVISYAIVPQAPSYPNRMLLLSLSAAISLFIGLAMAILIEKLDNTFRSANQLENMIGFPCFAMIPAVEGVQQNELSGYTVTKPSSTVAESVRTLRMVLNLRSPQKDKKSKVITITSSFPGEGKTTLSVWMARLAAKSGEKVILIDADLRRPNVHRTMGENNDSSLVDYLTGQKDLSSVIHKDPISGLHVLFGRSVPNSALDLLSGDKMKKLVASLQQVYDLVILDSPACLAVSDARVLAMMSDQTLYGVAWDRTPREVVMSGVKQFSDMGYRNLAFVLTNVDVQRHVRYGYGDTVYYYGRYKEYYAT